MGPNPSKNDPQPKPTLSHNRKIRRKRIKRVRIKIIKAVITKQTALRPKKIRLITRIIRPFRAVITVYSSTLLIIRLLNKRTTSRFHQMEGIVRFSPFDGRQIKLESLHIMRRCSLRKRLNGFC